MPNNEIWKMLEKHYDKYPQDFAGPVSIDKINEAETKLGHKFNPAYKQFLLKFGGATIGSKFIYGLSKQKDMDKEINDVIKTTEFYKNQAWPNIDGWYIVSDDFDGNPIGIDQEGKVWLSDHDAGFEHIKLADSFEEFLYKLHTDTLYE
jgi:cell wall assembly regulator SMI1